MRLLPRVFGRFLGGIWGLFQGYFGRFRGVSGVHLGGVWGGIWGYVWEVFGGVLEVCLWYFGRFPEGKHRGTIEENQCILIFLHITIFVICLISRFHPRRTFHGES